MQLRDFDLREVYSGEDILGVLHAGTVRKYFSMGAEGLLGHCAEIPIFVDIYPNFSEIRNGNHRAKALLNHGIYVMACDLRTVKYYMPLGVTQVRIPDMPEVEDEEYERRLREVGRII